ncbi:6-phosphogluconolactonase [Pancytospora epiphaga]|nr:6-phosphogluconolactonase [Pancytospora epiphaga]
MELFEEFHSRLTRTTNFQETIYRILKPYDGKKLNLMISGGSLLGLLDSNKISLLGTEHWNIFFADERCDPSALNYEDAKQHLSAWKARMFPIETVLGRDKAAEKYVETIEKELLKNGKIDLCLLGVGENGHICSLWPDSKSLESKENVVGVVTDAVVSSERVTVTINFINTFVKDLYFVIPPKNGVYKKVTGPHRSINKLISIQYTVILPTK